MKADIYTYKAELEAKLEAVNRVIADMGGHFPKIFSPKVSGKVAGKKVTTAKAILAALADGKPLKISAITSSSTQIKGKAIGKNAMAFTLAKLKKEKKIKALARGVYQLAK